MESKKIWDPRIFLGHITAAGGIVVSIVPHSQFITYPQVSLAHCLYSVPPWTIWALLHSNVSLV